MVVVLPTPPFWLHIAMMRAGPCEVEGLRLGEVRQRATGRAHLSGGADLERRVGIQLSLPGAFRAVTVSLALIGTDPISARGGGSGHTPHAVAAP